MEVYPLRQGYAGEAPQNLIALVRKVIGDWDGTNWLAVRHHLEEHSSYEKPLDDWTIEDVYQRFAIGWRKLALAAGGIVATAAMTITPIPAFAEVKIPKNAGSGGAPEKYTAEQLDSFAKWWAEYSKHCGSKKTRPTHQGFLSWGEPQELEDFPFDENEVVLLKRALRHRKGKTRRQNKSKR